MNDRIQYLDESIKKAKNEAKVYERHIKKLQEDRIKELVVTAKLEGINSISSEVFKLKDALKDAISAICCLCYRFNPHYKATYCQYCERINGYRKVIDRIK